MRDLFDIYTIIFLALAVFIFLRLRSVLGQRTGRERPPYDPYSAREAGASLEQRQRGDAAAARRRRRRRSRSTTEPAERWKGIAEAGSPAALGLDAVVAQDPSFDAKHFVTGGARRPTR